MLILRDVIDSHMHTQRQVEKYLLSLLGAVLSSRRAKNLVETTTKSCSPSSKRVELRPDRHYDYHVSVSTKSIACCSGNLIFPK